MKKEEIQKQLSIIFEDIFNLEGMKIRSDTEMKIIKDWDSLGHVRLISAIEEEFKIRIPIEDAVKFNKVDMILNYLFVKLNNKVL
jgi:acyl carrier protein